MTISAAINAYALSLSALTDLIGSNFFPERAEREDQDPPYVIYHLELKDPEPTLTGPTLLIEASFDVITMAGDYDTAFLIAEIIRNAFSYFKGVMGGVSGLQVEAVSWEETIGGYFPGQAAELGLFGTLTKFTIQYVA